MLSPRWKISSAELVEILGISWKEFMEWKKENLPVAEGPYGGQSLAEEDWWYLGVILRRHPDSDLAWVLDHRYKDKIRRNSFKKPLALEETLSGCKVYAADVARMLGVRWNTFIMIESQAEFPETDGPIDVTLVEKWWWATTLVAAFPNTDFACAVREKCIRTSGGMVVDQGAGEDNRRSEV